MVVHQINPKLIHALTNQPLSDIPASPKYKHLRGKYVRTIVDNRKWIDTLHPPNEMLMTCEQCSKSGKYNVGILFISKDQNGQIRYQMSGYFRCKHCNAAGPWKRPKQLALHGIAGLFMQKEDATAHYGELRLFDGSTPTYSTDAEEHYLNLIAANPTDSLLWNKLGNSYLTGARAELAMAAFEKSLELDPYQVESHISIANLLMPLGLYKEAIHHYHQMMLGADRYPHLEASKLRELLARGICSSFIAAEESGRHLNPVPSPQQVIEAGSSANLYSEAFAEDLFLDSENIATFYPLAESFMGKRADALYQYTRVTNSFVSYPSKSDYVRDVILNEQGFFTKASIHALCPHVSLSTVSRVMGELRKAGLIEMVKSGLWMRVY